MPKGPRSTTGRPSRVVLLAGGVGGAKLAAGLAAHLQTGLTVIVNTADDTEIHGLLVMPDHDTVMYTLAGVADPVQGWGVVGETFATLDALGRIGEPTWFRLGDRDLATHITRTARLRTGQRLTEVCLDLQRALGAASPVLPMADEPVRTHVRTVDGWLPLQDWFVRLHQVPSVTTVRFDGIEDARATSEVRAALGAAEAIVVGPSNPLISIAPILAVSGIRDGLVAARDRGAALVAVSPIVAGRALRGPADRMLADMGHEPTALGVARLYCGLVGGFVLDVADADLERSIGDLGFATRTVDTVMVDEAGRARLAADVLAFAASMS
jgi:LPPG:FO 2-phospho-L-lactate transferase